MVVVRVFCELAWCVRPIATDDVNRSPAKMIADHADEGGEARVDVRFRVGWNVFHHAAEAGKCGGHEASTARDELPVEVFGAADHSDKPRAFGSRRKWLGFGLGRTFGFAFFLGFRGFARSFGFGDARSGCFLRFFDLALFGNDEGEAGFDALVGAQAVYIAQVGHRDAVATRDGAKRLTLRDDVNGLGGIGVYWPDGRNYGEHSEEEGDGAHGGASGSTSAVSDGFRANEHGPNA